ncbi:MAG: hypothetical protein JHC84_10500 [Solirubrobacteraceae bacterium]|nr:hypothetical protein [Solirubrobacteraceae bacterium]
MSSSRLAHPAIALAAAAVSFSGAASATAAPPWSDPQVVAGGYLAQWAPVNAGLAFQPADAHLGFTAGGAGFTVLGRSAGGLGYSRFSGSRGAFGTVTRSTFRSVTPNEMALFGRSGVVLAGAATAPSDRKAERTGRPLDVAVTRGNVTGDFSVRQVLARGFLAKPGTLADSRAAVVTALAANAGGDVAVAVSVPVVGRTRVVGYRSRLFIRRRTSGLFKRVMDFGAQTVGSSPVALAVSGPGDVLVAWDDRTAVRARMVSARGTIGAEQRLGTGGSAFLGSPNRRITAAIDGTRRMLVAWVAQRVGEGNFAGSPGLVALNTAAPGKTFGRQQTLERNLSQGSDRAILGVAVQAAIVRDRGIVAWTGADANRFAVRTADVTSGRAGAPRALSAPGASSRLQGLVVGPRGGAAIVWVTESGDRGHFASARAAGASSWGPTETITTAGDTAALQEARVAASPVSGDVVTLIGDPTPTGTQPVAGPIPVRSSVRSAP